MSDVSVSRSSALTPAEKVQVMAYLDRLVLALLALTDLNDALWRRMLGQVAASSWGQAHGVRGAIAEGAGLARSEGQENLAALPVLVGMVGQLSRYYQELLRRAIALIEQAQVQEKSPYQSALLGQYWERLQGLDRDYCAGRPGAVPVAEDQGIRLLMALFFYSSPKGTERLWEMVNSYPIQEG